MSASGVRIFGGELRGRRLLVARGSRPSGARLREALFSIWRDHVAGARLLDLYSGSGAVALEAMSRGAAAVTLVESARAPLAALRRNLDLVDAGCWRLLPVRAEVATARLLREGERFDLLFADPPYDDPFSEAELAALCDLGAEGSRIALERRAGSEAPRPPAGWVLESERRYGDSSLFLYNRE